jgi:hypothetical protein
MSLRSIFFLITILLATGEHLSFAAAPTSAPYEQPFVGSVFHFNDGSRVEITSNELHHFGYTLYHKGSSKNDILTSLFGNQGFEVRHVVNKHNALWPLSAGKHVEFVADKGAKSWIVNIRVAGTEMRYISGHSYQTFVLEEDVENVDFTYRHKVKRWYSPELRITVKKEFEKVRGSGSGPYNSSYELVSADFTDLEPNQIFSKPNEDDYSICSYSTSAGATRWADIDGAARSYVKEARQRNLSLIKCQKILGPNRNSTEATTAQSRHDDYAVCSYATSGSRWATTNSLFVREALRRRLSLQKCAQLMGRKFRVAPSTNPTLNMTSFLLHSDISVCYVATAIMNGIAVWDEEKNDFVAEASTRGLTLRDCARLTGKEYKDSFQITRENVERKQKDAAEQVRLQAEAKQRAKLERIRKVEVEEQQRKAAEQKRQLAKARKKHLAPLRKKNRHSFAVIIGNKNYKGRTPKVSYAHNDADAMKRFVFERLAYREGNIIDIRDATRNEIATMFGNKDTHEGRLFNIIRAGKSDVMVFYSGHGVPGLKNRRPYLLPVDGDPNLAEITGYPVDVLYANLAKLPARSITVYLDACFSGESEKGMLISATSGISVTPKIPKSKSWMTVITAAQGDQFASWDEKAKHGLFTKHLLEALNGKADTEDFGNSDGKVSLAEVQNYLDDEMTYQARFVWNRQQKASVRGQGETVLASVFKMPKGLSDVASIEEMDATYVVLKSANLRAGPSTDTSVVGKLRANASVNVTGKVIGKNWYRLNDGSYVFGSLIRVSE